MPDSGTGLIGELIGGHYRVGPVIGEGGVCTVYRGEDVTRGRSVAIKVLPRETAQLEDFAQRFKRETLAAERIAHPSVPIIYASGALPDGALYLVMELLDGELLSQVIEEGPVAEPRAVSLTRQILVALDAAHQKGIVHRDVKPKNVMVVKVAGLETVKLFDFGIATNDRAGLKLTLPGSAFGTPGYISPEMAKGDRVDARADLYSVGVTLFEMVTGRLPFSSDDELAVIRAHLREEPPLARTLAPEVSPALEAVIARAMKKAPGERFASAKAMNEALEAIPARAAIATSALRPARSGKWVAAIVILALAAALAAAWLAG